MKAEALVISVVAVAVVAVAGSAAAPTPPVRTAFPSSHAKVWVCPEGRDGYPVVSSCWPDNRTFGKRNNETEQLRALAAKRLRLARRFERQRNGARRALHARARRSVWNGLECIHHFEGAWNDSGDPYWGGLQMDRQFQATYAPHVGALANRWAPELQIAVGIVAYYSGRGYGPWPNTRKLCGL